MKIKPEYRFMPLLSLMVISMLGLCLALTLGMGTTIEWHQTSETGATDTNEIKTITPTASPSLNTYSAAWLHSLFNQNRSADPAEEIKVESTAPSLQGLLLTGVLISTPVYKAFFKTLDGKSLTLSQGEVLPNGWTVEQIESHAVSLSYKSNRQELRLPVLKAPPGSVR